MNFDEVISARRSVRKYLETDVDDSLIYDIINSGILAPSAHNRQPWKIKILKRTDKDYIASLLLKKAALDNSIVSTANVIKEAPILIVIFYDDSGNSRDNDMLSLGAFIQNMHLKATSLGLGSLWIANTNYIKKEINEFLKIDLECISCLCVGYSDQVIKPRPRKKLEEIVVS